MLLSNFAVIAKGCSTGTSQTMTFHEFQNTVLILMTLLSLNIQLIVKDKEKSCVFWYDFRCNFKSFWLCFLYLWSQSMVAETKIITAWRWKLLQKKKYPSHIYFLFVCSLFKREHFRSRWIGPKEYSWSKSRFLRESCHDDWMPPKEQVIVAELVISICIHIQSLTKMIRIWGWITSHYKWKNVTI